MLTIYGANVAVDEDLTFWHCLESVSADSMLYEDNGTFRLLSFVRDGGESRRKFLLHPAGLNPRVVPRENTQQY